MRACILSWVAVGCTGTCIAQINPSQMPGQGMPGQTAPGQGAAGSAASQATLNSGDTNGGLSAEATAQTMFDKIFLRKAVQAGMAEVQLGQLATKNGNSKAVKAFGQSMVDTYSKMNETIEPIADRIGVKSPKKPGKRAAQEIDKLQGMSGGDFDQEYIRYMVKRHHADEQAFQMEMDHTADPALKTAAANGVQVIHQYLLVIEKIAKDENVATDERAH